MITTLKTAALRERVSRRELARFFAGVRVGIATADKVLIPSSPHSPVRVSEVENFFLIVKHKIEPQQRLLNRKNATKFNVFNFIEPDENKLSDVLAWLLNPQESHGQGDLFLRLLFKQIGLGSIASLTSEATVQREAPTFGIEKYRRRMDVLVKAGAWLVIENKVDSSEQYEQVRDYLEHLHRCSGGRNSKIALIYLTPNGRSPESLDLEERKKHEDCGKLHCWSYQNELIDWLEDCRGDCEAQRIKIFLADIIGYIESKLKREMKNKPERDVNDD